LETKTHAPCFTVSLRGYDREEVDEYLDSLAEALAQVEEAEERTRRLQAHVARCNVRIKELEDRIRADTPKSGVALGERIGVLLHAAEEAAAETVARADADAGRIIVDAEARAAEAEELMRNVTVRAEEQARRIETVARSEAAEIVTEAEARAGARTRQIEQWAEQVISHTRAEEARLYLEQHNAKDAAAAELRALADQRAITARTLIELRDAIGRAVGLTEQTDQQIEQTDDTEETKQAQEEPASLASRPTLMSQPDAAGDADQLPEADQPSPGAARDDLDLTGATAPGDELFESKLDAWVNGGDGIDT